MTEITLRPLETVPESELAALSEEVFADEQPSELLTEVLAIEAAARRAQADSMPQGSFGLAAFRGNKFVGWTQGYRLGTNQFHMLNSGVAAAERRTGVYTQLVRAVLEHAQAQGYVAVRSLHVAANSPVIIAKLRLGFYIAGFEYSEVYGPLVQLRYIVGEPRRRLFKARTVAIRPTPE
jgi:ribosomal protein S18 acetylase RimI-like enzyme